MLCSLVWQSLFVVVSPPYLRSTSPRKLQRQPSVYQRGHMAKQQSVLSEDTLFEKVLEEEEEEAESSSDEEPVEQSEEGRERHSNAYAKPFMDCSSTLVAAFILL